jgi:hypothetical protein
MGQGCVRIRWASRTVVLSTCPDTLLAVVGAFQFCEVGIRIDRSKKYRFVLRVSL